MDSKVTLIPLPNPGCSELHGHRSLIMKVFSAFYIYMPGVQMS